VQGQVTSLLKSDTLTFFGFDFSKAKMIGPEGFNNPKDIKERKIDSWNRQLTNDIKDLAFSVDARNKKVVFDVRPIKKINTEIDYQDLVVYNPKDLALIHSDSVWEQLKKLETDKYKGLGLIYVVDYFSQKEKLAQAYAVFFDIESKAVLMKNSVYGEPDGFGFSDYWGVALKNIIIKSSQYYGGWVKSAIKKERQKTKQLGAK
jgi:hypothetical protein